MVHPVSEAAAGREPVTYPHPSLEPILEAHARRAAVSGAVAADGDGGGRIHRRRGGGAAPRDGFKRSEQRMQQIEAQAARGDGAAAASPATRPNEIIRSITSFALYGFPESHAASFALLVYASAYLKAHYPAAFYTALLNNQPMGFYHPATLVKDAQRHGVRFAPIDVQESDWACRVEPDGRVRLGLMYVNGSAPGGRHGRRSASLAGSDAGSAACGRSREVMAVIAARSAAATINRCWKERCTRADDLLQHLRARVGRPSQPDCGQRSGTRIPRTRTRTLAMLRRRSDRARPACGATSWRRWPKSARSTRSASIAAARCGRSSSGAAGGRTVRDWASLRSPSAQAPDPDPGSRLPIPCRSPMTPPERLMADYAGTSLTIGPHPMAFRRAELALRGVLRASDLAARPPRPPRPGRRRGHHPAAARHREGVRVPDARGRNRHRQRHRPARPLHRAAARHRRGAVSAGRRDAADSGRSHVGEGRARHRTLGGIAEPQSHDFR